MIIKHGAGNYSSLDLNKQVFQTLHFYKLVNGSPVAQTDPTPEWIAQNSITDIGAGNLLDFIVGKVLEYNITFIDRPGDRYILL